MDTVNQWCLAEVVGIDQRTLNIHFDGWSPKWDCVIISFLLLTYSYFHILYLPPLLVSSLVLQDEFSESGSFQKVLKGIHWPE